MKDYSNYHPNYKDKVLNDGQILFDLQKDSFEGYDVTIDGVANKLIIVDKYNNPDGDLKNISGDIGSFNIGSVVVHQSNNWIVIQQTQNNPIRQDGIIQLCTSTLSFYDTTSTPHSIPCIVSNKSILTEQDTKYIITDENLFYVIIPNTEITRQIKPNDIFQIGQYNYYLSTTPDDITNKNLLTLKMKYSETSPTSHTFTVSILNGSTASIQQGSILQLNVQAIDNSIIIDNPTITYSSSNSAICTVSTTGLVSSITQGLSTITATFNSVSTSIDITVVAIPVAETYTLELTGNVQPDTEIKQGQTTTYTCVKKNSSGVVVGGALFDFTVNPGTTPADKYTFTVLNDTQCSIKCNSSVYYVDLVVTDRSDGSLTVSKHIKLRALF